MKTIIWHNPRCTKSRQTLALLEERGVEPTVRRYLDDPPTATEIRRVLDALGFDARSLMRKREAEYRELGLADVDDESALVEAMASHPKLIERPVVIHGDRAALGRPPENVLTLDFDD